MYELPVCHSVWHNYAPRVFTNHETADCLTEVERSWVMWLHWRFPSRWENTSIMDWNVRARITLTKELGFMLNDKVRDHASPRNKLISSEFRTDEDLNPNRQSTQYDCLFIHKLIKKQCLIIRRFWGHWSSSSCMWTTCSCAVWTIVQANNREWEQPSALRALWWVRGADEHF